jgi:hypothetical protein
MKKNMEQRKKGDKPHIFRNNAQGKPILQDPIMSEIVGKNPWKKSIHCCIYGSNHTCIDFPQTGDKSRTLHNVQQAGIVEDI